MSSKPPNARSTKAGPTTARRKACRNCATPLRLHFCAPAALPVDGDHVCVVPGGKPIIFFPMLALLEPGDEAIYPDPGFPIYRIHDSVLRAKAVPVPLIEERGFSFDLDILRDSLSARPSSSFSIRPKIPPAASFPRKTCAPSRP